MPFSCGKPIMQNTTTNAPVYNDTPQTWLMINSPIYGISPLTWNQVSDLDKSLTRDLSGEAFNVCNKVAVIGLSNHQVIIMDMASPENYVTIQKRNLMSMVTQLIKGNQAFKLICIEHNLGNDEAAVEVETEYNHHSAVCNFTVSLKDCCDCVIRDHEEQVDTAGYKIEFPAMIGEHLALALMLISNSYRS